jgi:hypothetical protein
MRPSLAGNFRFLHGSDHTIPALCGAKLSWGNTDVLGLVTLPLHHEPDCTRSAG